MRRIRTALLGCLLVAGLAIGPAAGSVGAARLVVATPDPTVTTGFVCHPNGSGVISSPSTTVSVAVISMSTPARDTLACQFSGLPNQALSMQFGGDCYFNASPVLGVDFAHRIWIRSGTTASLLCWGGTPETFV